MTSLCLALSLAVGVLLKKKYLTLFLGMSNSLACILLGRSSHGPVTLNTEPSENMLPIESAFLARKHHRSTSHTSKMHSKGFRVMRTKLYEGKNKQANIKKKSRFLLALSIFSHPFLFSWQVSYQEGDQIPFERINIWHSFLYFYGDTIAQVSTNRGICHYRYHFHAHDFIRPMQHGSKMIQIFVPSHRQQTEIGASSILWAFNHNTLWTF